MSLCLPNYLNVFNYYKSLIDRLGKGFTSNVAAPIQPGEATNMIDFLLSLDSDVVLKILMCLDDPADLIRVSAASQYLRNLVISNGLCKQLCMRTFPQLACITHVTEPTDNSKIAIDNDTFHREHKAYGSLYQAITSFPESFCRIYPVSASSTDHYPQESIINTLDPMDEVSYWSSIGHEDPEMQETLIYSLSSNFCIITEINITPDEDWLEDGQHMIFSARFVRFRMGHPKSFKNINRDFIEAQERADDKFVWTYTSQIFPMLQEGRLQKFELPEPVLCIGGFLQIELLGGVVKHPYDDKYYICVGYVEAIGRQLSPAFSVNFSEPSNTFSLNYNSQDFEWHSALT